MKSPSRQFAIKNDPAEIEKLATGIHEFCLNHGIGENIFSDIHLAVEEAISNTIKYGYRDGRTHEIQVRMELKGQKLLLEIEDDAQTFNPLEAPDPDLALPVEERPIGGLGIYLLRSVVDDLDYQRRGDKNILRITKHTTRTDHS